jgi:hypothetical protein
MNDAVGRLVRAVDELGVVPPGDVHAVLRRGRRRRRQLRSARIGGGLVVVMAVAVAALSVISSTDDARPMVGPDPDVPFGPVAGYASLCVASLGCGDLTDEQAIEQARELLDELDQVEIVRFITPEIAARELAAEDPSIDAERIVAPGGGQFEFRLQETTQAVGVLDRLVADPAIRAVHLGTPDGPPSRRIPSYGEVREAGQKPLETRRVDLDERTLIVEQHGSGVTCYQFAESAGCLGGNIMTGLSELSITAGRPNPTVCLRVVSGTRVADIQITLADGTNPPIATIELYDGLPRPMLHVACWSSEDPEDEIILGAYDDENSLIETIPYRPQLP